MSYTRKTMVCVQNFATVYQPLQQLKQLGNFSWKTAVFITHMQ